MSLFSAILHYLRGFAWFMSQQLLGDGDPMYILDEDVPASGETMRNPNTGETVHGLWLDERDFGWRFEMMGR